MFNINSNITKLNYRNKNIEECGYPYKFSIITAVYNTDEYLSETIDSLIIQDIGFEENVQLILIDDGSTDGSGVICDDFMNRYPNNIQVIHKRNGGVASARNAGIDYAKGKYLNFLDSDDKFTENTLSEVYNFFEDIYNKTDLVTIPIHFFDGQEGQHWQNWKFFHGTRVCNLINDYTCTCMFVTASFYKAERKGEIYFDSELATGEDAKVNFAIIYPKLTIGVLTGVKMLYRKRTGGTSLIQNSHKNKKWYLNFLTYLVDWAYDFYTTRIGYFPAFAQYTLLCDYQWRILQTSFPNNIMTKEEIKSYKNKLYLSLHKFEDRFILEQKKLYSEHKAFLISKKYDKEIQYTYFENDALTYINTCKLYWQSSVKTYVHFISLSERKFTIEGEVGCFGNKDVNVVLKVNDDRIIKCKLNENRIIESKFMGDVYFRKITFYAEVDLQKKQEFIQLYIEDDGNYIINKNIEFKLFSPLVNNMKYNYYYNDKRIVSYHNDTFIIRKADIKDRIIFEAKYLFELGKNGLPGKKAILVRLLRGFLKLFSQKDIWLISDRANEAGDNGEAFFLYLVNKNINDVRFYFCISKNSSDYNRLRKKGSVIPFLGWRYKLYCLLDAKIISTQGEHHYFAPFVKYTKFYINLMQKNKFIFLQHGIIMNDLSDWLNRYNKNISLFISTTKSEYKSILSYPYYYTPKQVKLTGLARYDNLYKNEKKYITYMPTWRLYLVGEQDLSTGRRELVSDIQEKIYYKMVKGLINNKRLLDAADEFGYKIRFKSHPNMASLYDILECDPRVNLLPQNTSYRDIFAESNMIITDYSSIAFDFAYLRKPVIYFQFDVDEFFSGEHTVADGYFDYKKDGFGEVYSILEDAVDSIIDYIKDDCKIKDYYRKRIDQTFSYDDTNNCERVYEAIKALDIKTHNV